MTLDTNYPVGFPIPSAASYFTSKESQEKSDQGSLSLRKGAHVTIMTKTGPHSVTILEKSFETCQNKVQTALTSLGKQNQQLNLALIEQTSRSKKMALLHGAQAQILENRVHFLQQQMEQLAKVHEENTKRLENLLSVAQQEQATALDLGKQTWAQEKTALTAEHQALQIQQSSLTSQKASLSKQHYDLRCQINDEPKRQQAAIQAKATKAKEYFIHVLEVEIEIASDPKRMTGRPADGKGAIIFLKDHLYNLF